MAVHIPFKWTHCIVSAFCWTCICNCVIHRKRTVLMFVNYCHMEWLEHWTVSRIFTLILSHTLNTENQVNSWWKLFFGVKLCNGHNTSISFIHEYIIVQKYVTVSLSHTFPVILFQSLGLPCQYSLGGSTWNTAASTADTLVELREAMLAKSTLSEYSVRQGNILFNDAVSQWCS